MSKKTITSASRRKFFKAAAVTGAAAVATVAMPNVGAFSASHGKTVTLKMQAAWPEGKISFLKWPVTM